MVRGIVIKRCVLHVSYDVVFEGEAPTGNAFMCDVVTTDVILEEKLESIAHVFINESDTDPLGERSSTRFGCGLDFSLFSQTNRV